MQNCLKLSYLTSQNVINVFKNILCMVDFLRKPVRAT